MPPKRHARDDDKKLSSGKDDGTKKFKRTHKFPNDREESLDLNNYGLFGESSYPDNDRENVEAINEFFGPDLSLLEDNPTSSNPDPDGSTSAALGITTDQDSNFPGDYNRGLQNLSIFSDDSYNLTSTASQNNNQTSSNYNPDESTIEASKVIPNLDSLLLKSNNPELSNSPIFGDDSDNLTNLKNSYDKGSKDSEASYESGTREPGYNPNDTSNRDEDTEGSISSAETPVINDEIKAHFEILFSLVSLECKTLELKNLKKKNTPLRGIVESDFQTLKHDRKKAMLRIKANAEKLKERIENCTTGFNVDEIKYILNDVSKKKSLYTHAKSYNELTEEIYPLLTPSPELKKIFDYVCLDLNAIKVEYECLQKCLKVTGKDLEK